VFIFTYLGKSSIFEFSFLKLTAIRRINLSCRIRNSASQRYTRAGQTNEQREARNKFERNRWNRNQQHRNVVFKPYRAAFNYNVEIGYSSQ